MKRLNQHLREAPSQADYVVTMALICISGNMAFSASDRRDVFFILMAGAMMLRMVVLKRHPSRRFLILLTAFAVLFALQSAALDFFAPVTLAGFFIKLIAAAAAMATVRNFRVAYVRCMVWITKLSFVFWIPSALANAVNVPLYEAFRPIANIVGVPQYGANERLQVLLFNFQVAHPGRNAAFFWEPGAFNGYLILAILFLATLRGAVPDKLRKRWTWWMVAGVLSTQSTTGFVILPLALMMFIFVRPSTQKAMANNAIRLIAIAIVLVPLSVFAWQLDFIGPKIMELWTRAMNREAGWELSRFGSVIFDWAYFVERPVLGWGQNNATQFALNPDLERFALGNGFSGYIRQLGLTGITLFIGAIWVGLRQMGTGPVGRVWFIIVILLLLNGEYFMDYPLFMALHFMADRHGVTRPVFRRSGTVPERSFA